MTHFFSLAHAAFILIIFNFGNFFRIDLQIFLYLLLCLGKVYPLTGHFIVICSKSYFPMISKLLALLEALNLRTIAISLIFTVNNLLESATHSTLRVRSHIHKYMALAVAAAD